MRRAIALAALPAAWLLLVAATPRPLAPVPPDLTGLVPFVSAPLDKPSIKMPPVALPAPPLDLPVIPPATIVLPVAERPVALMPPPRTLPCVGTWTGVATEALECARARYQRGELDDAARAFEQAVRGGGDREVTAEARYWLGETLLRLGRVDQADAQFRQAGAEKSALFGPFGRHASGWTALTLGDPARARDAFVQVLSAAHPAAVDAWARYGLGLSLYALGRFAEAEQALQDLLSRQPPPALARDAIFWHGDALGRTGQPAKAVAELSQFVGGGAHALVSAALIRLAWWNLVAKHPADALAALRTYPGARPLETRVEGAASRSRSGPAQEAADRDWLDATRALALLATQDWDGARAATQSLITRRSPLALPVQLRLAAEGLARHEHAIVEAWIAELTKAQLTPQVRAWLLLLRGDMARVDGKDDEARTQYDLARGIDATTEIGRYATFQLAQTNLAMREFTQALSDLAPLLNPPADTPNRVALLMLQAEAAYRAGDYKTSAAALERVLAEAPDDPQGPSIHLALAWTALRERRTEEAGRRFAEFAERYPDDEQTASALVLASEMALASGNFKEARDLLDRVLSRYARAPRTEFARLNRAILMLRSGDASSAVPLLRDWTARAPFAPLLGRAQVAQGIALLTAGRLDDAKPVFAAARREGEGALASLGAGVVALREGKLPDATREFTEARRDGTTAVAATAEYGLALVALQAGDVPAFTKAAQSVYTASPRGPWAPSVLYALAGVSADAKNWSLALDSARRLVAEFPNDDRCDDALERVGSAAGRAEAWPVAHEAYTLLREKYPRSPFVEDSRLTFGEAQLETRRPGEARKSLEQYLAATPTGPRAARARFLLARARETTGDAAGAVDAYRQAAASTPPSAWEKDVLFDYTRLLTREKHYSEARGLLDAFVKSAPPAQAAEGSFELGQTLLAQGDTVAAVEYFMTAAYIEPDSPTGRRALIAAGRALAAAKQPEAASTLYRKLLAQSNLPDDLAIAARQGLAELGH